MRLVQVECHRARLRREAAQRKSLHLCNRLLRRILALEVIPFPRGLVVLSPDRGADLKGRLQR
jgi:hypothetical protein